MKNSIDLKTSTHFVIDYRSLPSGIGHINYESGDVVLVTEASCGPQNLTEAKEKIKEESAKPKAPMALLEACNTARQIGQ